MLEHHAAVRAALSHWEGTEHDTAGDGFFASFVGPARAIHCAQEIATTVSSLGIQTRAGVHIGECEVIDGKPGGLAVTIGSRIAARGRRVGDLRVWGTVKDLVAGSGLGFDDAGEHELKGIPGSGSLDRYPHLLLGWPRKWKPAPSTWRVDFGQTGRPATPFAHGSAMLSTVFFRLSTWELWLIIAGVVLGFVALGYLTGRVLRMQADTLREPVGIVQGAFFALVGLILAFGLTLAIGRYDTRRAAVVDDANTIGTTYLRAQTLAEPMRSRSLQLLRQYTDASLALSRAVPTTAGFRRVVARQDVLQRRLWTLAGDALTAAPRDSAPRLYVETLNQMIDQQTVRVAALNNRIPNAVLALEVLGAAFAFGLLALYTAMHGRGATTVILAGGLVTVLLLVIFDLDRPTRGMIRVPDAPLVALRASMTLPPAARGPSP